MTFHPDRLFRGRPRPAVVDYGQTRPVEVVGRSDISTQTTMVLVAKNLGELPSKNRMLLTWESADKLADLLFRYQKEETAGSLGLHELWLLHDLDNIWHEALTRGVEKGLHHSAEQNARLFASEMTTRLRNDGSVVQRVGIPHYSPGDPRSTSIEVEFAEGDQIDPLVQRVKQVLR